MAFAYFLLSLDNYSYVNVYTKTICIYIIIYPGKKSSIRFSSEDKKRRDEMTKRKLTADGRRVIVHRRSSIRIFRTRDER